MDLTTTLIVLLITALAGLLLIVAAAAFLWWKVYTSEEKKLARRIARLDFRDKLSLAAAVFTDSRIPVVTRVIAVALVLYLASPIDILPDFIPVVGFLDDLLIVMIGAGFILRTIPHRVIEEHVERFEYIEGEARPVNRCLPSPGKR